MKRFKAVEMCLLMLEKIKSIRTDTIEEAPLSLNLFLIILFDTLSFKQTNTL